MSSTQPLPTTGDRPTTDGPPADEPTHETEPQTSPAPGLVASARSRRSGGGARARRPAGAGSERRGVAASTPGPRAAAGLRILGGKAGECGSGSRSVPQHADPLRRSVATTGSRSPMRCRPLTSHRTVVDGRCVRSANYRAGDMNRFDAAIYVGTIAEEARSRRRCFRTSRNGARPMLWMGANIGKLFVAEPAAGRDLRLGARRASTGPRAMTVDYSGQSLRRTTSGDVRLTIIDAPSRGRAQILAWPRPQNGAPFPWAVRSGTFTYVGEVPYGYVDVGNRYLAAADIIARMVRPRPTVPPRRALLRLEDVGPNTDPQQIRDIADFLSSRHVPFSIATYGLLPGSARPRERRQADRSPGLSTNQISWRP